MAQSEAAAEIGVTEPRISQLMTGVIKPSLEKSAVIENAMDLYKDDKRFSLLQIQWITI